MVLNFNQQIQREREERKEHEKIDEEKRKQREEEEARIEKENEEKEKRLKEEQEKREYEEYLKLKAQFTVEEEGQDEASNEMNEQNLLEKFVDFIKNSKVVVLEDLAAEFKMKTQVNIKNQKNELQYIKMTKDDNDCRNNKHHCVIAYINNACNSCEL